MWINEWWTWKRYWHQWFNWLKQLKYTRYIINDAIDVHALDTDRPAFKPAVTVIQSVVAVVGFVGMSCFLPMTVTIDGIRSIRFRILKHQRNWNHWPHVRNKPGCRGHFYFMPMKNKTKIPAGRYSLDLPKRKRHHQHIDPTTTQNDKPGSICYFCTNFDRELEYCSVKSIRMKYDGICSDHSMINPRMRCVNN